VWCRWMFRAEEDAVGDGVDEPPGHLDGEC
jgi:hypothetical protein